MATSIGFQLGIGSGLDIQALVKSLADAQRAPKDARLTQRSERNAAQLSGLAQASSAIDSLSAAITSLIGGGTLTSKPTSSNEASLGVSVLAGAQVGNLNQQVQVRQLALSQNLVSVSLPNGDAAVGPGELTLTTGGRTAVITIDATNDSLTGLAAAVNGTNLGISAEVITDADGTARLVMKGQLGAANAFTLTTASTGDIERFQFPAGTGGGMTAAQTARNAIVRLDGVDVQRATNTVDDLVSGVRLELKVASTTVTHTLGVQRPSAQVEEGVGNFVAAYNEVAALLTELTAAPPGGDGGALRGDGGMRELRRQLAQLPLTQLSSGTGPKTLAEIGVGTNRDGTLSVNSARLKQIVAADPQGVEALFNPGRRSSNPLVTITSPVGRGRPGSYVLTELVAGPPPSGMIDGFAMDVSGNSLIAPVLSRAAGLTIAVSGGATSATITIDAGLGGALQAIRERVLDRNGTIAQGKVRYEAQAKQIGTERETLETRSANYFNQLLKTFTAMDRQVSAFKATQSYLDQQVKMWTNSRN